MDDNSIMGDDRGIGQISPSFYTFVGISQIFQLFVRSITGELQGIWPFI
jgi:hypothetical protein